MKKTVFFIICLCFLTSKVKSQHLTTCFHDFGKSIIEKQHPGYTEKANQVFDEAKDAIRPRTGEVYSIPVVVHVVWKNSEENVSDEKIKNQIEVLNNAFRRRNADTTNLRPVFHDVAADTEIEFYLHEVVRVKTTADFNVPDDLSSFPDEVKFTAQGGSDAFDTNHFLNIWVCRLGAPSFLGIPSPVLGYSYIPGSNAATLAPSEEVDGVVVNYLAFGADNPPIIIPSLFGDDQVIPLEMGRTTVHEVGHFFGLRHIWGEGLLSSLGFPDCINDDGISDTPMQGVSSQYTCDPTQNTCDEGAGDLPDMIENYMDYSLESCQNTFTKEQGDQMRSILENFRPGLISPISTNTEVVYSKNTVTIFPNPTSSQLTVKFKSEQTSTDYFLINSFGKTVLSGKVSKSEFNLNLSEITSGIYSLLIKESNGRLTTHRVVKA